MSDLESLATILPRTVNGTDLQRPDLAALVDYSLDRERLVVLPPTATLEADLAHWQALRDGLPEDQVRARGQYERLIADGEHTLRRARVRDQLQTERPEGCWCLGLGGRIRTALAAISGEGDEPLWGWRTYCDCPDGQRQRAANEATLVRIRAVLAERRLERFWQTSGIPEEFQGYTLDSYPASRRTRAVVATLRRWSETPHWLLLYGETGAGKSGIAAALLQQVAQSQQQSVLFVTVPRLLDRIRETYGRSRDSDEASEADIMASLREVDLLLLDDLGVEQARPWVLEKLFTLINERYNTRRGRTIITTNKTMPELAAHLSSRVLWRITQRCTEKYVILLEGPNLRDAAALAAVQVGR